MALEVEGQICSTASYRQIISGDC